jgi:hypothetical protein
MVSKGGGERGKYKSNMPRYVLVALTGIIKILKFVTTRR